MGNRSIITYKGHVEPIIMGLDMWSLITIGIFLIYGLITMFIFWKSHEKGFRSGYYKGFMEGMKLKDSDESKSDTSDTKDIEDIKVENIKDIKVEDVMIETLKNKGVIEIDLPEKRKGSLDYEDYKFENKMIPENIKNIKSEAVKKKVAKNTNHKVIKKTEVEKEVKKEVKKKSPKKIAKKTAKKRVSKAHNKKEDHSSRIENLIKIIKTRAPKKSR